MPKTILTLLCFLVTFSSLVGQEAFGVGEKLFYRVQFSGFMFININAGFAKIEVQEKKMFRGNEVYLLRAHLTSKNTTVDKLFRVRDTITSYWDIQKQQPRRSILNLKEGRYYRNYTADFDLARRSAKYSLSVFKGNTNKLGVVNKNAKWEHSKGEIKKLPKGFQDIVGSVFKMRSDPRRGYKGQKFYMNIIGDRKQARLRMTILNYETITVASGRYKTIKVQPYVKGVKFFESYGKIFVWVSDDKHRFPVKIEAIVPIAGKITAELVKVVKAR